MDLSKLPLVLEDMILEYVTQLETTEKYDKVVKQLSKIDHITNGNVSFINFKDKTVSYYNGREYSNTETLFCVVYGGFSNQNTIDEYEEFDSSTNGRIWYNGAYDFGDLDMVVEDLDDGDFKIEVGVFLFGSEYEYNSDDESSDDESNDDSSD